MSAAPIAPPNKAQAGQRYTWISAAMAFVLWGSWAGYINADHGFWRGLFSGLTQGLCSLVITLIMTRALEWQYNALSIRFLKIVLPPIATVLVTGTSLVAIHYLIGTPNIAQTVTPALSVAILFGFMTTARLAKPTSADSH
ncbi:hypothetical protein [Snodgrassella sp. CFCC 13594]|uniref:hypothetical protein n=1 Tax=Snodgrassella sp. CFCC 13594 TaxID=1775559 RepID=UPI000831C8C5|nr:hypothetical protein [Snodgrassella sp. CFCC 13594]